MRRLFFFVDRKNKTDEIEAIKLPPKKATTRGLDSPREFRFCLSFYVVFRDFIELKGCGTFVRFIKRITKDKGKKIKNFILIQPSLRSFLGKTKQEKAKLKKEKRTKSKNKRKTWKTRKPKILVFFISQFN